MLSTYSSGRRRFSTATEAKVVVRGQIARQQLLEGCDILADAVGSTLGPRGRNVLIQQSYGGPRITKDGVTVARSIELADPMQELGASLIKQVAQSANAASGDGTTTATILAREIFKRGCEAIAAGLKPLEVLKGVRLASDGVLGFLKDHSRPVENRTELFHIARVSANGDEVIGKLISEAIGRVGKDGVVTVADGKTINHNVVYSEGYEVDRGYVSPYFVTDNQTGKCVMDSSPHLLLSEDKITNIQTILPVLEHCANNNSELLIIADDFDPEVLSTLIVNKLRGGLKVCAVKAPSFGEYRKRILEDLGVLTDAVILSREKGIETAAVSHLGKIGKAEVNKERCIIMDTKNRKATMEAHIAKLKRELGDEGVSEYEASKLKDRLAKLTSGVAVIHVGGGSEIEVSELKDRVEDALNATRAAVRGGILPGGGSALLHASIHLPTSTQRDQQAGIDIVRDAIRVPLKIIAENAGYEGAVVVNDVLKSSFGHGFDALSGEHVDMYKSGILDPTPVVETSLRDAVSVATMMCTTEAAVYIKPQRENTGVPGNTDM